SQPVAAAVAERWHEGAVDPVQLAGVSTDVLVAIALAGARRANEEGQPALASAYTRLPTGDADDSALLVERTHAEATISGDAPFPAEPELARLSDDDLVRLLQLRGHAFGAGNAATLARLAGSREIDERAACE